VRFYGSRRNLYGEFQGAEPFSNSLFEKTTIATKDFSSVLPTELQIPINLPPTIKTLVQPTL